MCDVDHVHILDIGGKLLLAAIVGPARFILVIALRLALTFLLRYCFAGLLKHPTISIVVVGWLIRGAMDLARPIKYFVQGVRALLVPLKGPLIGSDS